MNQFLPGGTRSPPLRGVQDAGGVRDKGYLVIGLYSDFGTDWAYPSIRTIARHAGLSRQTVLTAIEKLTSMGLLATNKAKGRSHCIPDHPPSTPAAEPVKKPRTGWRNWSKIF